MGPYPHPRSRTDSRGPICTESMRRRVPASTSRRENTAESVRNVNERRRKTLVNSPVRWAADGRRAKSCSGTGETNGRALFRDSPTLRGVALPRVRSTGSHQEARDLQVLGAVHEVPVLELPLRSQDHLLDIVRVVRPDRAELLHLPLCFVDHPSEAFPDFLAFAEGPSGVRGELRRDVVPALAEGSLRVLDESLRVLGHESRTGQRRDTRLRLRDLFRGAAEVNRDPLGLLRGPFEAGLCFRDLCTPEEDLALFQEPLRSRRLDGARAELGD